jgi:hypothetical protein
MSAIVSLRRRIARMLCRHGRDDELLITLSIFVVCFVLFAR